MAVLKNPSESFETKSSYDYLKLFAAIEFGMNEAREHLEDDINRLCHPEANLEHGFIVHLYCLSESSNLFSGRDWSPRSPRILNVEEVRELSAGRSVDIFYGLADGTGVHEAGVWNIRNGISIVIP